MEKNIEITLLYDIYGKNLTKRQQDIFEQYYLYNLSLREIALNKNISYQAVRDSIKTSESMLLEFESNIGMLNLLKRVEKANELINNNSDINVVKNELSELLK